MAVYHGGDRFFRFSPGTLLTWKDVHLINVNCKISIWLKRSTKELVYAQRLVDPHTYIFPPDFLAIILSRGFFSLYIFRIN